jgi:hypothetical protein
MATWRLHINFADGEINIVNAETDTTVNDLAVEPGDALEFKCEDHGWGIQFIGEGSPDTPGRQPPPLDSMSVNGESGHSDTITVDRNALRGKQWDYVAAVVHDNKVYTRDPDIRIKER